MWFTAKCHCDKCDHYFSKQMNRARPGVMMKEPPVCPLCLSNNNVIIEEILYDI